MANNRGTPQSYPRLEGDTKLNGLLDDRKLAQHETRVSADELQEAILLAMQSANKRSSREMFTASAKVSLSEGEDIYTKAGKEIFQYFREYSSDPASRAYQLQGQHCRDIARQQFQLKALQKERMNSGWRYQYLAIECARATRRFLGVSDLGLKEADFNATTSILNTSNRLGIYVSVKNRESTIGGPDWPGAIKALEDYAASDKNKADYYLCVFAFVMERGERKFRRNRNKDLLSSNVELWGSDFFWPFFANYSYEEIMRAVLQVLMANPDVERATLEVPERVVEVFEQHCQDAGLLDAAGTFTDPFRLVEFFCNKLKTVRKPRVSKTSAKPRAK